MMKKYLIVVFLAALVVILHPGPSVMASEGHPAVLVTEDRHTFHTVPEGARIEHEFTIQNRGNAPLKIESIAESCSCITILSHDETIPPKGRGDISIRLDTAGYGGKDLQRSLTVRTNDPEQPEVRLTLAGKVEKVYTLTSKIAKLVGRPGERIQTSITVIPAPKYPFRVLAATAKKGENIQFRMEKVTWEGRPAFRLYIENKRKEAGRYFDKILLTTDNQAAATIRIGIYAHIREPADVRGG